MSYKIIDHPEYKQRGIIASALTLVLIIVLLLFKFFQTEFPLPEAEGLAVAFGNVEEAGGGNNPNPEPTPQPNNNSNETPKTDDVATVDDNNSDKVKTDEKPNNNTNNSNNTNNQNVNNNALFGGIGNGSGNGKQGDPYGSNENIGGTGRGDQGNGNGEVGNRQVVQRCPTVMNRTDWEEEGTAWVSICVSENGDVTEASFIQKTARGETSTITNAAQRKIAVACAKEYKYQPANGQGQACGTIPIRFRKQ